MPGLELSGRKPLQALSLLLWLAVAAHPSTANAIRHIDNTPERFCGPRLVNELAVLCNGRYATSMNIRKDTSEPAINDQPLDSNSPYAYKASPHAAQQTRRDADAAADAAVRRQRREDVHLYVQRGITEECCVIPCTRNTLRNYCGYSESEEQLEHQRGRQ